MFEATLDPTLLRDSITSIAELIDEAELHISDEGLRMLAADRAIVTVVDFMLSKGGFDSYKTENDLRIGVNLIQLLRILRRAGPSDKLEIKIDDKNNKKILLRFSGSSTRTFSLPIIDTLKDELPPGIDKLEWNSRLEITSNVLNDGLEDADLIADSVVLILRPDKFILRAESETSYSELDLEPSAQGPMKSLISQDAVRARFSLDYLKKMMKARKLSETVKLEMGTDYPLKMSFDAGNAKLSFVLAPRLED